MNKFSKNLSVSNKEIRGTRAEMLGNMLQRAQLKLINDLEDAIYQLKIRLENHTDLSPSQTTQLKFETPESGNDWVSTLQDLKINIALKEQELAIAKDTQEEWFTELKESKSTQSVKKAKAEKDKEKDAEDLID